MKEVSLGSVMALAAAAAICLVSGHPANGQNVVPVNQCAQYALIPKTVLRPQKVTSFRLVEETQYETEKTTTYKPVWKTEKRERKVTSYKPVTKTSFREEKYYEYQRVVERNFREVTEEQTVYDTVTEMQERQRVVEKPVVERSFRDEQYVVRKQVTETQVQTENVTVFRPQTTTQTTYLPTVTPVNQMTYQPGRVRNRLQFLRPGYYPTANGLAYKTGGMYWVPQQNPGRYQMQTSNVVGFTPQQVNQTTMVPETVTRQKPVNITRYVDTVQTRRVPYETHTTQREVIVEKVPVEVRKPRIVRTTRRVPYETVKMVPREIVKRIPVSETTYEAVDTIEPYEVKKQEWVAETSERVVPKKVVKRIPYETTQMVPVTEVYRVPLDAWGYPIANAPRELVETRKPVTSGQVVYGDLRVEEGPVQVVENSTQNTQPRSVVIRERIPYVEDKDLTGVQKPAAEQKPEIGGSGDDKIELKKTPVPEGSEKKSGSDNVDLKKQDGKPAGDDSEKGEGKKDEGKKGEGKQGEAKKDEGDKDGADSPPALDPKEPQKKQDGTEADGKLNGPKNDG